VFFVIVQALLCKSWDQGIKLEQHWCINLNVGDCGNRICAGHEFANTFHRDGFTGIDEKSQRIDDSLFTFPRRKFQNFNVHFVGDLFGVSTTQQVPGHTKLAGRKHFFTVLIVGKCSRLAQQRINDVSIIDRGQMLPNESRHRLNHMTVMSHDDVFRRNSQIDTLADQPTRHGIRVRPNLNRAAALH